MAKKKQPPYTAAMYQMMQMRDRARALMQRFDDTGDQAAGMVMARLADTLRATYDEMAACSRRKAG